MAKIFSTKLLNKMSEKGLEPSKISPYAPETYVSTSSTTPTNRSIIQFSLRLSGYNVVEVFHTLSENVTLSHLFFLGCSPFTGLRLCSPCVTSRHQPSPLAHNPLGRVPLRQISSYITKEVELFQALILLFS